MKKKPKSKIEPNQQILIDLDEINERCHRLTILAALLEHCATAPEGQLQPGVIGGAGAIITDELEHMRGGLRRLGEKLL